MILLLPSKSAKEFLENFVATFNESDI